MADIRLIALDLDGTLNNDAKQITPKTKDVLMRAQRSGIRLMLASARPVPGLYRERDALELQKYAGLLMAYNGGCISMAEDNRILSETRMPFEEAREALRFLKKLPVTPILDDGRQFYVTDPDGYMVRYECMNNRMQCTCVEDLAGFLFFSPFKILMSVQPEAIAGVQREIAAYLPESLSVVQTAPFYLEIIPKAVNKGDGLRAACRSIGCDISQTVAFGDSENDIPMLKAAGIGFAMENAAGNVRSCADRITLSNNEDGIAAALDALGI